MTVFLFLFIANIVNLKTIFQMHVLYVISFVIERVGAQIRPYADQLILYLPLLWDSDHNMLRCAILTTLIRLVKVIIAFFNWNGYLACVHV